MPGQTICWYVRKTCNVTIFAKSRFCHFRVGILTCFQKCAFSLSKMLLPCKWWPQRYLTTNPKDQWGVFYNVKNVCSLNRPESWEDITQTWTPLQWSQLRSVTISTTEAPTIFTRQSNAIYVFLIITHKSHYCSRHSHNPSTSVTGAHHLWPSFTAPPSWKGTILITARLLWQKRL